MPNYQQTYYLIWKQKSNKERTSKSNLMRRIFTFFLTFLLGVFVTALYAQTHTVSGTVIDKDANEPLIGANVLIKVSSINSIYPLVSDSRTL